MPSYLTNGPTICYASPSNLLTFTNTDWFYSSRRVWIAVSVSYSSSPPPPVFPLIDSISPSNFLVLFFFYFLFFLDFLFRHNTPGFIVQVSTHTITSRTMPPRKRKSESATVAEESTPVPAKKVCIPNSNVDFSFYFDRSEVSQRAVRALISRTISDHPLTTNLPHPLLNLSIILFIYWHSLSWENTKSSM